MLDRQVVANDKELKISQDLSLSHAGTVWDGALCQIAYLNKNLKVAEEYITGKNVLQLGSGTGILGLAASAFSPKAMILTDLAEYLKIIEMNKQKNEKVLNQQIIKIVPLEWGNFSHIDQITKIDTIIGSQLAYDKECVKELMKTLGYYKKHNPDLKIMISYQKYREEDINIQAQFKKHFGSEGYSLVEWSQMNCNYRDEGIGIAYVN